MPRNTLNLEWKRKLQNYGSNFALKYSLVGPLLSMYWRQSSEGSDIPICVVITFLAIPL